MLIFKVFLENDDEDVRCLFKQCNEHEIILNVSESYQR